MRRMLCSSSGSTRTRGPTPRRCSTSREALVGELRVTADRRQRDRLLRFAAPFEPRTWAIEAAAGLGALLAQQLVAAGETVLGRAADAVGAGAAVGLGAHRQDRPARRPLRRDRRVAPRLAAAGSAGRSHRGAAAAGRPSPRPHRGCGPGRSAGSTPCCACSPRAASPQRLGADQAAKILRGIRPDRGRRRSNASAWPSSSSPMSAASTSSSPPSASASPTPSPRRAPPSPTSTGSARSSPPIIVGHTGDIGRFPTAGHYARYNATAPIEASCGPEGPAPAQPPRQPAAQPRAPHRRGHPDPQRHPRPRLLRPQARRGQDAAKKRCARSSGASATPSTASSSPTPAADQTGPGGQTGRLLASVTGSTP